MDKILPGHGEGVKLVHGVGDKVFPPGQYLPHGTHLRGNMLDAVYNPALLIAENNIAVLSHDFHNQCLAA